jgi:hypothetical protein
MTRIHAILWAFLKETMFKFKDAGCPREHLWLVYTGGKQYHNKINGNTVGWKQNPR